MARHRYFLSWNFWLRQRWKFTIFVFCLHLCIHRRSAEGKHMKILEWCHQKCLRCILGSRKELYVSDVDILKRSQSIGLEFHILLNSWLFRYIWRGFTTCMSSKCMSRYEYYYKAWELSKCVINVQYNSLSNLFFSIMENKYR